MKIYEVEVEVLYTYRGRGRGRGLLRSFALPQLVLLRVRQVVLLRLGANFKDSGVAIDALGDTMIKLNA